MKLLVSLMLFFGICFSEGISKAQTYPSIKKVVVTTVATPVILGGAMINSPLQV